MLPLLKPFWIELLRHAWDDGTDTVGVVVGVFSLENTAVKLVLKELASRVVGIDATLQEAIQGVMGRMASEGLSVADARNLLLDMAVTQSPTRAELIALTESAHAYSAGSLVYYKETGQVSGTEWLLGPEPCALCEPLGGKVVPLGEEFADGVMHPPYHPRCTCAVAPILT